MSFMPDNLPIMPAYWRVAAARIGGCAARGAVLCAVIIIHLRLLVVELIRLAIRHIRTSCVPDLKGAGDANFKEDA